MVSREAVLAGAMREGAVEHPATAVPVAVGIVVGVAVRVAVGVGVDAGYWLITRGRYRKSVGVIVPFGSGAPTEAGGARMLVKTKISTNTRQPSQTTALR